MNFVSVLVLRYVRTFSINTANSAIDRCTTTLASLNNMNMKLPLLICLLLLISISCSNATQVGNLNKLIKSQRYQNPLQSQDGLDHAGDNTYSPVYVGFQDGSKEDDKIDALPGQPTEGVDFDQYAGYVTVDPTAGSVI